MPSEKLTFTGHAGEDLAARLDLPNGPHLGTALFAHCFTCSKDLPAARRIAERLAQEGFAVLRFDFTGLGFSAGEFANTNFSSNVNDLILAAQHLTSIGKPPDLLIGHSLGGAAVLAAADAIPSVKAITTIGAPSDPSHVLHNFGASLTEIEQNGHAEVTLAGRPFTIRNSFLQDVRATRLTEAVSKLHRALLVLHAPSDQTVGIENAAAIFTAAKHPKSFVSLDRADHLLSKAEDAEYAAEVIAGWVGHYLDLTAPPPPKSAPEGVVRVAEADASGFLQDISSGPRHHTVADEPKSFGGTDLGMSPYGFLAAGLGACTSMTIRMYARRKGWPLDHVSVDVTHDKEHGKDNEIIEQDDARIDHFNREIHLIGALTDSQRSKLLEIADKCPVHKTLEKGTHVRTTLAQD